MLGEVTSDVSFSYIFPDLGPLGPTGINKIMPVAGFLEEPFKGIPGNTLTRRVSY
jgi:hypothetical protein